MSKLSEGLSRKEAAKVLNVSEQTLKSWQQQNYLHWPAPDPRIKRKWSRYGIAQLLNAATIVELTRLGINARIASGIHPQAYMIVPFWADHDEDDIACYLVVYYLEQNGGDEAKLEIWIQSEQAYSALERDNRVAAHIVVDLWKVLARLIERLGATGFASEGEMQDLTKHLPPRLRRLGDQ